MIILLLVSAYSFITGFIYYNFETYLPSGEFNSDGAYNASDNYMNLNVKYKGNMVDLNRDAFEISKDAAVRGFDSDQATRDEAYKFCTGCHAMLCKLCCACRYSFLSCGSVVGYCASVLRCLVVLLSCSF
jgi:hypothetical protein